MAGSKEHPDYERIAQDVPISDLEAWLYRNSKALAAVRRGLQEAAEGKAVSVGSFAKHAGE